jgi:HD-GYP domain-containing protein (c-di-GMP phosphodiesterase class II)
MDLEYALGRIKALSGSKFDEAIVLALESAVKAGKLRLTGVEVHV